MSRPMKPRSPPSARVPASSEYSGQLGEVLAALGACEQGFGQFLAIEHRGVVGVLGDGDEDVTGAHLNVRRLHVAVVVALHLAVADVDLGAHRDVEHAVLEDLALGVHAVRGHAESLLAQFVLELRVAQPVVALDLFDGAVDLVVADGQLQLGRLLGQQLVVDEAIQNFAADGVGPGLALAGVGDGCDIGQEWRSPILDLALQDEVVADQRRDLFHHAGMGRPGQQDQAK
jgi:hypothetical protein